MTVPLRREAVKCKWVFKVKPKVDRAMERYNARLVAKVCSQVCGINYVKTYSPIAKLENMWTILSRVAIEDLEIMLFDIKTTLLHGELTGKHFMEQPKRFVELDEEGKVCRLLKSL